MSYLLLLPGVLLTLLTAGPPVRPPSQHKPFPHFRPTEKRRLRHYKPKTWRERTPEPRPQPAQTAGRQAP